ncbi:MAG TPA: iron donor protein CyaY [Polyangiaceae bacterium]|nr:iron donor protein CyaY [Polyangiaceae bacterium]
MDEAQQYEERAHPELRALIDALDALDLDNVEAELANEIVTLEFADGAKYVINSHRAARQIWMAAERTAWHFDWVDDKQAWIDDKRGHELWQTVSTALSEKLGRSVRLTRG